MIDLKSDAKLDKSTDAIMADIDALQAKITHNKKADLLTFKPEIKQFLEEEIVSRYYFQNGRLESSFKDDNELKEALAVLNDGNRYKNILTTIVKSEKPMHNVDKTKLSDLNNSTNGKKN